ncbi:beta-hydroxyacid dehydrogenase, 3-hydroxyisobutyrate dehydrogenase [Burkholderiales bacterium JOSHI_001]|nr:beta-hydroxyacid dehydrogenase, 3-hydroxyisobutyrate dehydrogenase [Burkholderiales bacterium JOSHI_001]
MGVTMNADSRNLPRIGFIGLGVMGTPMASHLARAGHALTLCDVNAQAAQQLAATLGAPARAAATPREVGQHSDIVITMLPHGDVVQQVALGPDGLIEGLVPGSLVLDTSSSEPWLTQRTAACLAECGVAMVDAPVSGAQWGARDATLVFMVGGAAADVARVRPLLDRMGREVFHLGALGCGHAMKCINNLITAMTFSATAEGLVIGKRYGLDPAAMVKVLNVSTGMSWISQTHIEQRVLSRRFDDPFKLALMLKDIGIANTLARETGSSVPISALGQQLWQAAVRDAEPGASVSELVRWVEKQNHTEITPGARPAER